MHKIKVQLFLIFDFVQVKERNFYFIAVFFNSFGFILDILLHSEVMFLFLSVFVSFVFRSLHF